MVSDIGRVWYPDTAPRLDRRPSMDKSTSGGRGRRRRVGLPNPVGSIAAYLPERGSKRWKRDGRGNEASSTSCGGGYGLRAPRGGLQQERDPRRDFGER